MRGGPFLIIFFLPNVTFNIMPRKPSAYEKFHETLPCWDYDTTGSEFPFWDSTTTGNDFDIDKARVPRHRSSDYGWICPRCEQVWSPHIDICECNIEPLVSPI